MKKNIIVVGLGAGDLNQMTLGVFKRLKEAQRLFLRTKEHPVIEALDEEEITYQSFDPIYEKHDNFQDVYKEIVKCLFDEVNIHGQIVYAVPGHPLVAEKTVQLLLQQADENSCQIEIEGGQSFLDPIFSSLHIDPIEGFQLLDGTALEEQQIELQQHIIICQVYDSFIASEVKLSLMEILPDEYDVYIVTAAGSSEEQIKKVKLYELDRETGLNNLTSVYVPPVKKEELLYHDFTKLRKVIAQLRGPNGCPWDKKQTHQSLKKYLLEETYEVLEAINEEDEEHLVEELGDVLLQIMLHAQIGEDDGFFTIQDVIRSLTEKMVRRHPHVFGDVIAETADDVVKNWDEIKIQEKGQKKDSVLNTIPKHLPGLTTAYELQKNAAKVGFDWKDVNPMWEKVMEELSEFKEEVLRGNKQFQESEFGDILFAMVNIARFYQLDPEIAIHSTNQKFKARFHYMEDQVMKAAKDITNLTLEELDYYWEQAKQNGL